MIKCLKVPKAVTPCILFRAETDAVQGSSDDIQRSVQELKYHFSNSKATFKCYPKLVTISLSKNISQIKFIELKQKPDYFQKLKKKRFKKSTLFHNSQNRDPIDTPSIRQSFFLHNIQIFLTLPKQSEYINFFTPTCQLANSGPTPLLTNFLEA